MSTKDRRKKEKELRRQAILESAKKVFLEKGIEKSTISDIANDCQLARGTLYLYFKNKNELILSLYLMRLKDLAAYLEQKIADQTSCIDKIIRFYRALYTFYKENPAYLHLACYWDYFNVRDSIDEDSLLFKQAVQADNRIMQRFTEIFNEGIAKKEIRNIKQPLRYITATDIALVGLIKQCLTREKRLEEVFNFTADSIIDTFLTIVKNDLLTM